MNCDGQDNAENTADMISYETVIDLNGLESVSELHDRLAAGLPVPEYYGRNLDALNDFLTSCFDPISITFENYEAASAGGYGRMFRNLKRLCDAAASENEKLSIIWK